MAHTIIAIDAAPPQHEALKKAINERKYSYGTKGNYNIPHLSEIKFYNVRAKKEIMPHFLFDLGAVNLHDHNKFINSYLSPANRNDRHFSWFKRLRIRFGVYMYTKTMSALRINPPEIATTDRNPLVTGWHFAYCFGNLKDIETAYGEEL